MSKQDKLFKDTIITAAASGSTKVTEDLLSYFVDIGNKECFAAMLYIVRILEIMAYAMTNSR